MAILSIEEAAPRLGELVAAAGTTGERVVLAVNGQPAAAIVRLRDLVSLDETIELLSSGDAVRRLADGDAAFTLGDVMAATDLGKLDPSGRLMRTRPNVRPGEEPWELVVSGPAAKSVGKMPVHLAEMVVRYMFEQLRGQPQRVGIELRGQLSRRFAARVETETLVYRLDSVKRAVRVIEVLHRGGIIGQVPATGQRW